MVCVGHNLKNDKFAGTGEGEITTDIEESDLEKAIQFLNHKDVPKKELYGYERQKMAGLGRGISVVRGGFAEVVAFGFPGTGKSDFPYVLVNLFEEKLHARFSLAYIKCDRFAGKLTSEIVGKIMETIDCALKNTPSIIAFDEIDTLALPIDEIPTTIAPLAQWLRGLGDETQTFQKVILLAATNYPRRVDVGVFRRFRTAIYFEMTDENVLTEMIEKELKIDERMARKAAQKLFKEMEKCELTILGCNAFDACKQSFQELRRDKIDWNLLSSDRIVEMLMPNIGPGGFKKNVDDWMEKNRGLIEFSLKHQMPYLVAIAERYLERIK